MDSIGPLDSGEMIAQAFRRELADCKDLRACLIQIMDHIHAMSDVQAIAIRLHEGNDYPYYVYYGFPESFIVQENFLCPKSDCPQDMARNPMLACMCGNVIEKRFDPTLPFFTEGGSFFSNHTTELLANTSAKERQAETRNYCNSCGYESVGLFPLRDGDHTIGLIQLNDFREDMLSPDVVELVEKVAANIGSAVARHLATAPAGE